MQVHVVGNQIDWNGVIHGDLHNLITRFDLYVFSFCRNSQVLHNFEDIVANLFFRVAVHHRKPRLLLNFVRKLIFRRVGRHDLYRRINRQSPDNRRDNEGLYFPVPALAQAGTDCLAHAVSALLARECSASNLHSSKLASAIASV